MKRILIVDDVEGWRKFHSDIVKEIMEEEVEIITSESAQAAYDILLQNIPFDIIITDLQMENLYEPKYAGEWLVEQIRTFKCYLNTKVVIISAAYNVRTIAENLNVECIPKPTALKCISAYKEILT